MTRRLTRPKKHGYQPGISSRKKSSPLQGVTAGISVATAEDASAITRPERPLPVESFMLMFDNVPLAINVTSGTTILYANPSYLNLFGFASLEELCRVEPLALFAPEHRSQVLENIQRRAKGLPAPDFYEAESLRKDGTRFPMLMYLTKVMLADRPATVGFITDISRRRQVEAQMALKNNQLAMLNQLG